MGSTARSLLPLVAAAWLQAGCGADARDAREPGSTPTGPPADIENFERALAILPPSPVYVAWADVDALRDGPLSPFLDRVEEPLPVPGSAGTSFMRDNLDSIHRLAGGIYITLSGPALFVVIRGGLSTEELFAAVKQWAGERSATATPCKVRGRPGLRIADTVLVDAGSGLFINGPEPLATRTLDLMHKRITGSAEVPQLTYLASHTIGDDACLVIAGIAPPGSTAWLEKKNLPSVVGSRFLLSVQTSETVDLRLGLLPGRPIKPIWFAQEVNTFLVRAAEDDSVVELGMSEWVEGLEVELLGKGIVVRGSLEGDRLLEVAGSMGGA